MNGPWNALAELAWAQFCQVTVVCAVVLLLVSGLCRHRPHVAHVLLLLALIKCLTPPVLSSPVGFFGWSWSQDAPFETRSGAVHVLPERSSLPEQEALPKQSQPGQRQLRVPVSQPDAPCLAERLGGRGETAVVRRPAPIGRYLVLVWVFGAVLFGAFVTAHWAWHLIAIRKSSTPATGHLAAIHGHVTQQLGLKRRVRLLVNSRSYGPSCFGVLRPVVVLPARLVERAARDTIEPILIHELVHIRRGDTLTAVLQAVAGVIWWFHPLVWRATRELSRARERCCDVEVVVRMGGHPGAYAQGILNVLKTKQRFQPTFLASGIRPVEVTRQRLEAIMSHRTKFYARTPWHCWILLVAGVLLIGPGSAEHSSSKGESPKQVQRGQITPADILAAWKRRSDAIRTVRARIKVDHFVKSGVPASMTEFWQPPLPEPMSSAVETILLDFDNKRSRFETTASVYSYGRIEQRKEIEAFANNESKRYAETSGTSKSTYGAVEKWTTKRVDADSLPLLIRSSQILLFQNTLRGWLPLRTHSIGVKDVKEDLFLTHVRVLPTERAHLSELMECEVLNNEGTAEFRFWVDPTRDYVVVRGKEHRDGKLSGEMTISYDMHPSLGPIFKEMASLGIFGTHATATTSRVIELELNSALDESLFQFEFPEGTTVHVWEDGRPTWEDQPPYIRSLNGSS